MLKCIICNKEFAKINALCRTCFEKKVPLVKIPETIDLTRCKFCSKYLIKKHWETFNNIENALEKIIKENANYVENFRKDKIELKYRSSDNWTGKLEVKFFGYVEDEFFTVNRVSNLRIHEMACPDCSRERGGYFEAIVQLRGLGSVVNEELLSMFYTALESHKEVFVSKKIELKNGVDIYLSDKNKARIIAKELLTKVPGTMKETVKLHGQKEGKNIYRHTILVKLYPFREDDFIIYQNELFVITAIHSKKVTVRSLKNNHVLHILISTIEKENLWRPHDSLISEGSILSVEKNECSVMDLSNYKIYIAKCLEKKFKPGETVKFVEWENQAFIFER